VSKVSGMTGAGGRIITALRGLPRMLREDLWTAPVDPIPPVGAPGSPVWRPVFGMLLTFGAAAVSLWHVPDLVPHGAAVPEYVVLLVVCQALALLTGMWHPLYAWWASLVLMVVSVRIAEPTTAPGDLFPWTGSEMALQSGALFLLTLRVRPRRAVLALALSLLTGLVSSGFTTRAHNYSLDVGALAVIATVVIGAALRALRVARTELVEQSELTEEERSRRTLLEERNRIARELHDVVAHHMSVISIQAQVAPHLVENPSEELRENLAGIRENAVEALAELRRCSGCCARRTRWRTGCGTPRSPPWTAWTNWSARSGARASPSRRRSPAGAGRSRRGWSCRPSASCRRPSATCCGTLRGRVPGWMSVTTPPPSRSGSPTPPRSHP